MTRVDIIEVDKEKKYTYYFEELKEELKNLSYSFYHNYKDVEDKIQRLCSYILAKALSEFNCSDEEKKYAKLNTCFANHSVNVQCGNLFTACLLFNYYVPFEITKTYSKSEPLKLRDGNEIYYDFDICDYKLRLKL